LLSLLPSLQRLDSLPGVDHIPEILAIAIAVGVRMRASHGLAPRRIKDLLIDQTLRCCPTRASVLNQNPRALRSLIDRAGRRQSQPACVLLPLLSSSAVPLDRAKMLQRRRDRARTQRPALSRAPRQSEPRAHFQVRQGNTGSPLVRKRVFDR